MLLYVTEFFGNTLNLKVFLDIDRLFAGQFDKSLLDNIRAAKHFILILTRNSLDPCIGDVDCRDWVHLEVSCCAFACENRTIGNSTID